jgi:hypothetical protein
MQVTTQNEKTTYLYTVSLTNKDLTALKRLLSTSFPDETFEYEPLFEQGLCDILFYGNEYDSKISSFLFGFECGIRQGHTHK